MVKSMNIGRSYEVHVRFVEGRWLEAAIEVKPRALV